MIDSSNTMTFALICAKALIFILCQVNRDLYDKLKHFPYVEHKDGSYYRWFTSGFVHANFLHLFMNLFVLYQFGTTVEHIYKMKYGFVAGGLIYLLIYVFILVLSGLPTFLKFRQNYTYSSIGASGAVSGILFIYILYYPFALLYFLGLLPIPALLFGMIYLGYSKWASGNTTDHIDHDAHYYGALFGIAFGLCVKYLL